MTQIKFALKCPQCGSTRFKGAVPKPGPDDPVTCLQCGTTLNLAAEKKRLEDEARTAVEQRLRGEAK